VSPGHKQDTPGTLVTYEPQQRVEQAVPCNGRERCAPGEAKAHVIRRQTLRSRTEHIAPQALNAVNAMVVDIRRQSMLPAIGPSGWTGFPTVVAEARTVAEPEIRPL